MSFINLKKGKKTSVICGHFTAFLILFSMSVGTCAIDMENHENKDGCRQYYEVTSAEEAWTEMDLSQQIEACNCFSEEQLYVATTRELLELAKSYPLGIDAMLFDTYEEGIEHLISTSDVFEELVGRRDLKIELLDCYEHLDGKSESDFLVKRIVLEGLIRYQWKHDGFTAGEKKRILKHHEKLSDELLSNYLNDIIITYIDDNQTRLFDMLNLATRSDGFTGDGTYWYLGDMYSYVEKGIYTKYGTSVECFRYISNDYSYADALAIDSDLLTAHPSWVLLGHATKRFNCHSYAWLMLAYNSNDYWINDPTNYALASSYFCSNYANSSLTTNQKVLIYGMKNGETSPSLKHSAVVSISSQGTTTMSYMTTAKVRSKLGASGIFLTTMYDVYVLYGGTYYIPYTPL